MLNNLKQLHRILTKNNFKSKTDEKLIQKALLLEAFNGWNKTDVILSTIVQRYMGEINIDFKATVNLQMGIGKGEIRVFNH